MAVLSTGYVHLGGERWNKYGRPPRWNTPWQFESITDQKHTDKQEEMVQTQRCVWEKKKETTPLCYVHWSAACYLLYNLQQQKPKWKNIQQVHQKDVLRKRRRRVKWLKGINNRKQQQEEPCGNKGDNLPRNEESLEINPRLPGCPTTHCWVLRSQRAPPGPTGSVPPSDEELLKLSPATVHLNRPRHNDMGY